MADSLEALQARLQQVQTEYLRTLQETWDAWLKQYDELSQQQLCAYQDLLATYLQNTPHSYATADDKE